MSALVKAAQSIEVEIAQTQARLQQLQAALAAIHQLSNAQVPVRAQIPVELPVERTPKTRRAGKRKSSGLPATGNEFWFGVLGSGKKTMGDIVDGALKKLQLDESARKTLLARATSWLYPSIKSGTIKAAGKKGKFKAYQAA